MLEDGVYLIEAMSPCEDDIFTKEKLYRNGVRSDGESLPEVIESCRRRRIQSIVWLGDKYVGGTWFDLKFQRWCAELNGIIWYDREEMKNLFRL